MSKLKASSNKRIQIKNKSQMSTYSSSYDSYSTGVSNRKFIPQYAGPSNAFTIQLFCIEEKYESR